MHRYMPAPPHRTIPSERKAKLSRLSTVNILKGTHSFNLFLIKSEDLGIAEHQCPGMTKAEHFLFSVHVVMMFAYFNGLSIKPCLVLLFPHQDMHLVKAD